MSRRRNGARKDHVAKLDAINALDKKIKRKKLNEDETDKLLSQRQAIVNQLKTNR